MPNLVDFSKWLSSAMAGRGWDQAELARQTKRMGYSIGTSQISRVINCQSRPGPYFCIGIAHALGEPIEDVMRRAGVLRGPRRAGAWREEIMAYVDELQTPDSREALLKAVKGLAILERAERGASEGRADDEEPS